MWSRDTRNGRWFASRGSQDLFTWSEYRDSGWRDPGWRDPGWRDLRVERSLVEGSPGGEILGEGILKWDPKIEGLWLE